MKELMLICVLILIPMSVSTQVRHDSLDVHLPEFKNRPIIAAIETFSTNIIINRYDAWARGLDWAKVTPSHWYNNLHNGFDTDGDSFSTNFFAHPYHGSLFFNSARKNGSSFWGAIPYVLVGSWTWEYFGETYPPSEIDWNTTTLGGVYLGEITHRLSANLLRDDKRRQFRFIRNLSVTILNPIGQLNGWFYNDIDEASRSPHARQFPIRSQFSFGYSKIFKSKKELPNTSFLHIDYSLMYGDLFAEEDNFQPFDFFIFRTWLDINSIMDYNQNYFNIMSHAQLWKFNNSNKHLFTISSHYDFIHNNVFKIGALSLTADYYFNLKSEEISLMSGIKLGPLLFGSASSDIVEVIELFNQDGGDFLRDYVYGRGYTLEAEALLIHNRYGRVIINLNNWMIYTQRDSPGTERNSIIKFEYHYPIWNNWSLGAEFFLYHRAAHYNEFIEFHNIRNSYSEFKLLGSITF